jgi:hypothetical protein
MGMRRTTIRMGLLILAFFITGVGLHQRVGAYYYEVTCCDGTTLFSTEDPAYVCEEYGGYENCSDGGSNQRWKGKGLCINLDTGKAETIVCIGVGGNVYSGEYECQICMLKADLECTGILQPPTHAWEPLEDCRPID